MPHLVMLYTPQLNEWLPMGQLCRDLADAMLDVRDEADKPVFPPGGTRVLAYPAAHHAVGDDGTAGRAAGGSGDYAFMYLNLRMAAGRSPVVHQRAGAAVLNAAKTYLEPLMSQHHIGLTVQVDESPGQVFDAKFSNIHPLFAKP